MDWPIDPSEVVDLAVSLGLTITVEVATQKLESAIGQWELDTGFKPFLRGDSEITRRYTPDSGTLLSLEGGFLSVSSLKVGITYEYEGTTLVENRDYFLHKFRDQEDDTIGYDRVEFLSVVYGTPKSISVTGVPGLCSSLRPEVKMAVMGKALALADIFTSEGEGPVESVTQGPVTVRYDTSSGGSRKSDLESEYYRVMKSYQGW